MNDLFQKLLEVSRLTRSGNLAKATSEIQQALMHGLASTNRRDEPPAAPSLKSRLRLLDVLPGKRRKGPTAAATGIDSPFPSPHVGARFSAGTYSAAVGTRQYKLFEPSAAADLRPLPLVLMLHGCTQDPDDFASGTRMNALAEENGFWVLYPAQAPRSNVSKCWNWFVPDDQRRGQGEPELLAGMTRQVMAGHRIDPDRVYVAGLSAGGAMAAILGHEYPDLFAAVGVHSGLPPGAAHDVASAFSAMQNGVASSTAKTVATSSSPRRALSPPTIAFHGDRDNTVHPSNGERVIDAAIDADSTIIEQQSTESRAATQDAAGVAPARRFTRTVYTGPHANSPSRAELWVVHGAGHAWSGGSHAGTYTDPSGPDATREMFRFFLEHPMRAGTDLSH